MMAAEISRDPGRTLAAACENAGFDLTASFSVAGWNARAIAPERLPLFGDDCLGLVVGNTRRFWGALQAAYAADTALQASPHPLDAYAMAAISTAAERTGARTHCLWAHTTEPTPIPIQRIAQAAGLAWLSPSHLSVHPTHGPWISLRAVVVVDAPPPPGDAAAPPDPCTTCAQPCVAALRAVVGEAIRPEGLRVGADWRGWLAVRDSCPVGRAHRFSDAQIEYHYVKTRPLLRG